MKRRTVPRDNGYCDMLSRRGLEPFGLISRKERRMMLFCFYYICLGDKQLLLILNNLLIVQSTTRLAAQNCRNYSIDFNFYQLSRNHIRLR
jgi:hypothetical protein